ncbi:MAG: EF-P lysine aminoacylase EpmA [Pseudomonadales bacterium]
MRARADLARQVREFFYQRGVLEAQTATLAACAVTDPAVEAIAVPGAGYLQTSPEYQLKRLLAAGAPSLYQLGPVFRAGEAGSRHNPEFTMLEWYRLGFDHRALMAEVADLVSMALGPAEYRTLGYAEVVARAPAAALEQVVSPLSERERLDLAFSAGLDTLGAGRYFIVDYPADQAALARLDASDPTVSERFELVVDGLELANGYHELGDAQLLRRRFEIDQTRRRAAGQQVPAIDERFLAAMAEGLPDCAGVALGFDRLLMLRTGARSLREVLAFPADLA